jgi:hypothetical protein
MATREKTTAVHSTKSADKPHKPKFDNDDAERFWNYATSACDYLTFADTPLLVLASDVWAQYRKAYREFHGNEGDAKFATLVCKWIDRVYKMLVCLGMTPAQRKNLGAPPIYESIGPVERREPGGGIPAELDDEEDAA